ncbi:type IV secretion protein Rhs [Aggregatibacter aphrophilus NJ8700]|uniref:type VI secretion system tip protein TssI/VgrG n=3 Tax=Aggregatibacter aphrophilus TaxID=732 RepID=UPI0001AADE7F|nr:type VI secretion system tip protein TssI/VgrG [Aggregatibacter aphrophilus]ACS96696.1 Rhs family protein [Aggregatibacter aphrophilus NJ8700]AKS64091.1 type IV secretion protein Rhs [Aggregatibacter aphrophilus NJ8700]
MTVQSDYRYSLTVNGSTQFEVVSFVVTEHLSELFRAELELASFDDSPKFSDILDHPATLTFWQDNSAVRHLNGIVTGLKQGESGFSRTRYSMVIEPALSRADLQADLRIFQQQDSQKIIETLLSKNQVAKHQFHLKDSYWTREYCVQYRETDLEFIKRLAAEEGTYYYFEHTNDGHSLHFSNSTELAELKGDLLYNAMPSGERPQAAVWRFAYEEKLKPTLQTLRDYTFTNPRYNQEHQSTHNRANVLGENRHGQYELYDYPGRYKRDAQGKPFSQYRLEYEQREAEMAMANSDDLRIIPGYCFSLSGHTRSNFNQDWLVVGVVHRGWQSGVLEEEAGAEGNRYENEMKLIPHGRQWRPTPQPRPVVDGPQVAHVVGPADEEIYCDEWGRVKIQFPWDRLGNNDEHSSCWVRVSQGWAGAQFGAMMIPRIGHEVIVDFLEGDPDQPIITGRTYHSTTEPPYNLPEHKTRMTIKSKTHKGNGFNELRFEDEKDREEIFIHAEKDQNNVVNNDETTNVGRNRTEKVGRNEKITVGKNRSQTIKQNEMLTVGFNRMTNITMNELHNVGMMRSLNVLLDQHEMVGQSYDLKVGKDYHIDAGNNTHLSTAQLLTLISQNMHVTGKDEIRLDSKGGHIHINEKGITLKGIVTIEGPLTIKGNAVAGGHSVEGECIACKQAAAVGRPVNPILGIKLLSNEVDFAFPGLLPLNWQRSYFSDVAHTGWLGQGWLVNGCQRIESRMSIPIEALADVVGEEAGSDKQHSEAQPAEQLVYVDEQGREIPLPSILAEQEPVYIQAEQIWTHRLSAETIRISSLDKTVHFTFMRQGEDGSAFVLTQITDNHGNCQQFLYGQDNLPYAIKDGNGRVFALQFANISSENQTNIEDSSQRRLTHVYLLTQTFSDIDLALLQETLKKSTALSHTSDESFLGRKLVSYRYNTEGDLIEVTDGLGNLVRKFGYRNHLMISHEDSAGLISTYEYDHYTPNGKVTLNTTNLGERWEFAYFPTYTVVTDALGRREEYHFDEHNELVKLVSTDGQAMLLERDKLGRVLRQTSPSGQTSYFEYNPQGQMTKLTRPDNAMLYFLYDNDGRLIGQTDALGNMTRYRYDDSGNLIERLDALSQKSVYAYNDKGLLSSSTDPLGNNTLFAYDENFQLNQVTDCSGNQTCFKYNELGQLTSQTDALGNTTAYQYNDRQQLIAVLLPNQSQTRYQYDKVGRLSQVIDPQGNQTSYQYRIDGLPTSKTNAQGHHFQYHYDQAGRLVGLTNENHATYRFVYDEQDRLIWEKGFDDKLTQYEYDAKGQLIRRTDYGVTEAPKRNKPAIRTAEFKYNQLGQMTEEHIRQGEQSSRTTFSFDLNGQMTQVACGGQHIDFRYDATGRLIEEAHGDKKIAYEYDANNNRLKTVLPSGDSIRYFYYGTGHLSGIKLNSQLISEMERDDLHREISRSQGRLNGRYYYDDMGRLVQQQAGLANQQNAVQIDRTYGYDELGHLSQTRTYFPHKPFDAPQQTQYQYDNLGRIAKADSQGHSQHFYFDPASNLINDPTEKVIDNRVVNYRGIRFTYDSLGNLVECQAANGDYQRYTYDLKNRLVQADIRDRYKAESWVYEYDPLGRRVAKSKLNKQGEQQLHTQFIWDGSHLVQEIRTGNHQQNAEKTDRTFTYIYSEPGSYEPLAQCYKDGDNAEHTINYFHSDQIGIPREMTDSDGKLIWKGRYDAWGSLIRDSYRETASDSHQPFRLQNQYFDEETGLHYNFFRYYEPVLGRFITQDPIKLAGGNNLYRFEGTVQNQTDPLGLFAPALLLAPELIALGKAALITLGVLAVGAAVEETVKNRARASTQAKTESTSKCKKCPPCITTSGRIVPPKTIGYRPLDVIPDDKMEHGVYGSHHNIFESNQAPYPNCKCFWSKQKYVLKPYQLTPAMVPVEPFVN